MIQFEHIGASQLLAFSVRDGLICQCALSYGSWCRKRRKAQNGTGQGAGDGVSVLSFSIGEHNDDELIFRKVIEATAVAEQRSMLADPAMILLMVQDHGEAILCFGILGVHLCRSAFSRGHELEGLG